jgi:hypothetical protein
MVRDVLANGGLVLQKRPDGILYVHIPLRPETIPVG